MTDGISISVDTRSAKDWIDDHSVQLRRSTESALLRTGNLAAAVARKRAPVYSGPKRIGVIRGELGKSIKASRVRTRGSEMSTSVGPTGKIRKAGKGQYGVPLYASKQEARLGFMSGAKQTAESAAEAVFESAIESALRD